MPAAGWIIIILCLGFIVGGIMLLRKSAKPLPLSKEQLEKIKQRNSELDQQEQRHQ